MADLGHLPAGPGVYCVWLTNGGAYVGKSLNSIRARVAHHIKRAASPSPPQYVHRAIAKHGVSRVDVEFQSGSPDDVASAEKECISKLKSSGVKLYNLTVGGDGKPGFKWSAATRAKIVPSLKASWTKSRKREASERANAPEYRSRVSASQKASWTDEKRKAQRDRMRATAPCRKLTSDDVVDIARRLSGGASCASISRLYGVTPEAISAIKTGKNWSYVTGF